MTVSDLQKNNLYKLCRVTEQRFLEKYIASGGDMYESVKTGWPNCNPRVQAIKLQKNELVAAVLDEINGFANPSKQALVQEAWKTLRMTTNVTRRTELLKLIARLEGYETASPERDRDEMIAALLDRDERYRQEVS